MTDDEWWWTHLERKGCLWGGEVMWKRAWKDRRTTQNVEYSTIPKYTKYTEYTKYTKYTKYTTYSTIAFYIHCHIYMFHDFCSLVAQSLASALWCGVQITLLLVPPKSWRGGKYIQNIYKIYTEYIKNVSACEVFSALWLQTLRLWCFSDFGQTEKKLGITGLLEKEQTGIFLYLAK